MKTLSKENLNEIESLMFNKGLDIDVSIYNYFFNDMPRDFVLYSLSLYQNKDGGFGHGLQYDSLNPNSTSFQTLYALRILQLVQIDENYNDDAKIMLKKIFNYLYNKNPNWAYYDETNNKYPTALYLRDLKYNKVFNEAIIGLTISLLNDDNVYYRKAIKMIDKVYLSLDKNDNLDYEDIVYYNIFFSSLKSKNIKINETYYNKYLEQKINFMKNLVLNQDNYYYIPSIYDDETEIIDKLNLSLDMIIDNRKAHGMYEVTTSWNTEYPEEETQKLKWLGRMTVKNLYYLNKYNRIER